jgi:hypothetical protein
MKIGQVVEARPSLQKLATQDLSIKTLYKISKLLGKLDEELVFYSEQRTKVLDKYCDIVGNQYVPREDDVAKLNAEMGELMDTDIEYEIKEVVINTDENIKLSYNDLVQLKGFVRIGEVE